MTKLYALIIFIILSPILILTYLLILLIDGSPVVILSKRIGKNRKIFLMPKFRTMKVNTPQVATHKLKNVEEYYIPFGKVLRNLSLDELPQILSVIKGDMIFIGPRPALYNQLDLVKMREKYGINDLIPGITGWAQVNGRDENNLIKKVELERYYLKNKSIILDLKIILLTLIKVILRNDIKH
jgi:O-antigen biosynthesis protein WbqP